MVIFHSYVTNYQRVHPPCFYQCNSWLHHHLGWLHPEFLMISPMVNISIIYRYITQHSILLPLWLVLNISIYIFSWFLMFVGWIIFMFRKFMAAMVKSQILASELPVLHVEGFWKLQARNRGVLFSFTGVKKHLSFGVILFEVVSFEDDRRRLFLRDCWMDLFGFDVEEWWMSLCHEFSSR